MGLFCTGWPFALACLILSPSPLSSSALPSAFSPALHAFLLPSFCLGSSSLHAATTLLTVYTAFLSALLYALCSFVTACAWHATLFIIFPPKPHSSLWFCVRQAESICFIGGGFWRQTGTGAGTVKMVVLFGMTGSLLSNLPHIACCSGFHMHIQCVGQATKQAGMLFGMRHTARSMLGFLLRT